jgi:hypothetical protein
MAMVRYERNPGDPLTRRQKENLKQIATIKDGDIDFSEIPELTEEWFTRAVRGTLREAMQATLSTKRKARR